MLESVSTADLIAGNHFDDLELFGMFNVEVKTGELKNKKGQVVADKTTDLWGVTVPRNRYNVDALSPADLRREQKAEKARRAEQLASLVAAGAAENLGEDQCLTDLLESPEWVSNDCPEVGE